MNTHSTIVRLAPAKMPNDQESMQLGPAATQKVRTHLLKLPNELLQQVACNLTTDQDVLRLSRSCKEMWEKVFEAESAFWRDRFAKHYDLPPGRSSRELKIEYQIRAIVLNSQIRFKGKEDERQYLWMEVMQTMLEESLLARLAPGENSKTLHCICEILKGVDFLSEFEKEGPSSPLFYALQLCLTPISLNPLTTQFCRRTDYDMEVVYSCREGVGKPYISHDNLDLRKLLHLRCFWQRHFLTVSEFTYFDSFTGLPPHLRPSMRKDNPADIPKLSRSWLGFFSCMHPISDMGRDIDRQSCADFASHGDTYYNMTLELEPSEDLFWPEGCSKIIPLVGGSKTNRTYFDGKQSNYSADELGHHVFGFTEEIDHPHGGFQRWTRICFTIIEAREGEEAKPSDLIMESEHWIYAYEAVIIPGGRLMLGRWVDMKDTEAKGPFIFWDV